MDNEALLDMLRKQVVPALGCTEPVSVAIAVSAAFRQVGGEARRIAVTTSLNVYKNGMRVGIPGTRRTGIPFAAALAVVCGDPDLRLEVFRGVRDEHEKRADELLSKGIVRVTAAPGPDAFYVKAVVETDRGVGECLILESHTNVVEIRKDGKTVCESGARRDADGPARAEPAPSLADILRLAGTAEAGELSFLLEGVRMNLEASSAGETGDYSSGLGRKLQELIRRGRLSDDLPNRIRAAAASACDARMAGLKRPVMSSAGSGNHGITAILPLALAAREHGKTDEELCRALAVSHLITALIKLHIGKLSPVCGCAVAAGAGASGGLAWLMGGREEKTVGDAVNNMIGCLGGMFCDGAKGGCSYKVAAAASEAYYQALAALEGATVSPGDGLIGETPLRSIENMARVNRTAMDGVDACLVEILSGYGGV